jgi:hypothetical protein
VSVASERVDHTVIDTQGGEFRRKFCNWLNPFEKTEQAYAANE